MPDLLSGLRNQTPGRRLVYAMSPPAAELYRRSATYIDKILKGANPGDLPVERPKKIDLLINLKVAKQIGVTIPQAVLSRADRVTK